MKIAVYAITLNEEKYAEKFMKSATDADAIYITDTGSTDNTKEILQNKGAIVSHHIINWSDWPKKSKNKWKNKLKRPWRFDIARNKSLFCIPEDFDICICLDLDEVLCEGWREHLERQWKPETTRIRYKYIWSHYKNGDPNLVYWGDKIHTRNNYKWNHPVHEVLQYIGREKEIQTYCDLVIEHFPDKTKSRGQYLPLLELAVWEDPDDDRNAHYLGREYFNKKMWIKAKKELKRHLVLPKSRWDAERAASMRYLAKCYKNLGDKKECLAWYRRACTEAPNERESWLELAQFEYDNKDYLGGYYAAKKALEIKKRPLTYMTKGYVWGENAYDLAGTCAYYIGLHEESRQLIKKAWELAPNNLRIIANLKFVRRNGTSPVKPIFWFSDKRCLINSEFDIRYGTVDASPGDIIVVYDEECPDLDFCLGWETWLCKFMSHFDYIILMINDKKIFTAFDYCGFKRGLPDNLIKTVETDLIKIRV